MMNIFYSILFQYRQHLKGGWNLWMMQWIQKRFFFSNLLINIQTLKYQNLQQEKTKYDKESMHTNVKIMTSEKLYVSSEELK